MSLRKRINAPTPDWFKKIIAIGLTLSGVGVTILGIPSVLPNFQMPHIMTEIASWLVVAGLVAASVSKTAKDDTPKI